MNGIAPPPGHVPPPKDWPCLHPGCDRRDLPTGHTSCERHREAEQLEAFEPDVWRKRCRDRDAERRRG